MESELEANATLGLLPSPSLLYCLFQTLSSSVRSRPQAASPLPACLSLDQVPSGFQSAVGEGKSGESSDKMWLYKSLAAGRVGFLRLEYVQCRPWDTCLEYSISESRVSSI